MNIHDQILELSRLDDLITRSATGTLEQLAEKFDMSESSMKRHLRDLKDTFDAPVVYDREAETYHYTKPFNLMAQIERLLKGRD